MYRLLTKQPAAALALAVLMLLVVGCGPIEGPQDLFDLFLPDAPPEQDLGDQAEGDTGDQPEDDIGDQLMDEFEQLPLGDEPTIGFVSGSKSRANCAEGFGGTFCEVTATLEVFYGGLESQGILSCQDVRENEFGYELVGPGSGSVVFNIFYDEVNRDLFEEPYQFANCQLTSPGSTEPLDTFVVGANEVEWE